MINRSIAILPFIFFAFVNSNAQERLVILGSGSAHYLEHTVAAKENWYMLGRMYNQRPKDLAAYNHTSIDQTLPAGKVIQVPLNDANFSQASVKVPGEEWTPVYHKVGEKEWMFRISQTFNKVPVSQLEKWNGITSEQIKSGMWLIVGHLKVRSEETANAVSGEKEKTDDKRPAAKVAEGSSATGIVKQPSPPAVNEQDGRSVQTSAPDSQGTNMAVIPVSANHSTASHKGGSFKKYFNAEGKSMEGNAGIFKSSSGWDDGKYYALVNNIPVGTIIRVTFSSTSKSIYAKVLGQLPEMKESQGLSLRISDAAASELGAEIGKFYVQVAY